MYSWSEPRSNLAGVASFLLSNSKVITFAHRPTTLGRFYAGRVVPAVDNL